MPVEYQDSTTFPRALLVAREASKARDFGRAYPSAEDGISCQCARRQESSRFSQIANALPETRTSVDSSAASVDFRTCRQ